MLPSYMIRYQFDTSAGDISTDQENILIGFSTQEKQGTLMFVRNDNKPPEYISIEINNNGSVFRYYFVLSLNRSKFMYASIVGQKFIAPKYVTHSLACYI